MICVGAKHRNKAAKAGLLVSDISSMASSSVPVNDIGNVLLCQNFQLDK